MPRSRNNEEPVKRVAILVDTSTSWGRDVIGGVHRYSRENAGWQLFVEPRGVEQRRWLPTAWKGDGVIARVGFSELAKKLKALKLPVVNVSGITLPNVNFPRVLSDQVAAANLAAEHLLARGFRNFGYFSLLGLEYVAEHQQAFVDTLRRKKYDCDVFAVQPHLGAEPDWNLDMKRLGKWLHALPKPLAVFTWNSSSARELIYACTQSGIVVPEVVAVLSGADDDLFCEVTPVPISAVKLDCEQIGYRAAAELHAMMQDPRAPTPAQVMIPPKCVVERQSTDTLAVDDPAMVKALRFIRENPARVMNVNDVAVRAGLCRRALEIRFQNLIGRSPASEIRRVRIDLAIDLLKRTNLPVAMVAERSGFSSPEYMASVFRNQLSTTPVHYRKQEKTG
ncbi:MAG: substrate-binding domain-containing protein [Gloeobacteraceae cyanobacterium ES-bin-144]|nr:substrate-binding domain-containing protein [Verrucomicrobiales bacterium]